MYAARDHALLFTLLHGLRISEAVGLDVEDYRYGQVTFAGKGDKTRSVPLRLAGAQDALNAYIGHRKSGPMFRGPSGRLSTRQAQRIIGTLTLRGTGTAYNAHAMRHSFATSLVRSGVGLAQVAALLGHATTQSTQIYTHLSDADLAAAVDQHPLAEGGAGELHLIEGAGRRDDDDETQTPRSLVQARHRDETRQDGSHGRVANAP